LINYFFPSWRFQRFSFLKEEAVWYSVFITDWISIPLTYLCARLGGLVSPNGVSAVSCLGFFISVVLMFTLPGQNLYYTLGFIFSAILDDVDGKLARLRKETSTLGELADAFFDMWAHGLGLSLVGLAMSLNSQSIFPFLIILPYALYMGNYHATHMTQILKGIRPSGKRIIEKTDWQKFCDRRGLCYDIYTHSEIIFISILLIGINLKSPSLFLFLAIYLKFLPQLISRLVDRNGQSCSP